uniref:Peptidase S8/S53 domain-containing protein n=1 Tax=Panagrolaimus sp. ES5 TaxID=591445 RepID=A0AC34FM13_9BILA
MPDMENFIPKEATQQSKFVKKYPEYDGRGIKIAIIDSDVVDKSLPGMQKTTTGLPKIICGACKLGIIVDTSTIVKSNGKNYIIGKNGRKLIVPRKYKNPSDKWHLGCTSFEGVHENYCKCNCEKYENFEEHNGSNVDKLFPVIDKIFNCVIWFDGEKWRACIDTSSLTTDLNDLKILTNFEDECEVAYLPNKLPYCINVLDDGNALQILCPPDDHGTSVAHVVAAYFPGNPESNGLAPGSQIVSLRWRDFEKDVNFDENDIIIS